jgi:hypothetical protein
MDKKHAITVGLIIALVAVSYFHWPVLMLLAIGGLLAIHKDETVAVLITWWTWLKTVAFPKVAGFALSLWVRITQ